MGELIPDAFLEVFFENNDPNPKPEPELEFLGAVFEVLLPVNEPKKLLLIILKLDFILSPFEDIY